MEGASADLIHYPFESSCIEMLLVGYNLCWDLYFIQIIFREHYLYVQLVNHFLNDKVCKYHYYPLRECRIYRMGEETKDEQDTE